MRVTRRGFATVAAANTSAMLLAACERHETKPVRLGLLVHGAGSAGWVRSYRADLVRHLQPLGWTEGLNLEILQRTNSVDGSLVAGLLDELAAAGVAAIVVNYLVLATIPRLAAKVPLVCFEIYDAEAEGLTGALARPSGQLTGVSWQSVETASKRLGLARELVPSLKAVLLIADRDEPGSVIESAALVRAARQAAVEIHVAGVPGSEADLAVLRARAGTTGAILVSSTARALEKIDSILAIATDLKLPTISEAPPFADRGALLTYGPDPDAMDRLGAAVVDKLLRGATAADVPIVQPARFELVINRRTARTLGLEVPRSLLLQATRQVE